MTVFAVRSAASFIPPPEARFRYGSDGMRHSSTSATDLLDMRKIELTQQIASSGALRSRMASTAGGTKQHGKYNDCCATPNGMDISGATNGIGGGSAP